MNGYPFCAFYKFLSLALDIIPIFLFLAIFLDVFLDIRSHSSLLARRVNAKIRLFTHQKKTAAE